MGCEAVTFVLQAPFWKRPTRSKNFQRARVCMEADGKKYKYLVVGGGNSAGYVAQEFVAKGVGKGELAMIGREEVAPYERPTLSKAFLFKEPPVRLPGFHTTVGGGGEVHKPDWYEQNGIDLVLGTEVKSLDVDSKTLSTDRGNFAADNIILATGSGAVALTKLPGGDLENILTLRENADGLKLAEALHAAKGKNVVVIGGGYIGMEVSAAANMVGCIVTLLYPDKYIMSRLFEPELAAMYEEYYKDKGVKLMKDNKRCTGFKGQNGRVTSVIVDDNGMETELEAEVVVVGVGAKPNVQLFEKLLSMESGGVKVDGMLQSNAPGIYAIGDVAAFPVKMYDNRTMRTEHVAHARQSAKHVVNAILGSKEAYDYLPFFYSRVFDLSWQFFGDSDGDFLMVGDMKPKIAAFWVRDGQVNGAFMESPSAEDTEALRSIATARPRIDTEALSALSSADDALAFVKKAISQ